MKRIIGTCLVGLALVSCGVAPSNTLRSSGSSGSGTNQWEDEVLAQLDYYHESSNFRYFALDTSHTGVLRPRESESWDLNLTRGQEYVVVGVCDTDCSDVDLVLYDSRGAVYDSDTELDDFPILRFRPSYSGHFSLEVRMYDCRTSVCYYGFSVYRN